MLFDGEGGNYMVHASRREAPGMAEIHTKDADIVYVLDGTATLVTGGTAVDLKTTGPDEFRGQSDQRRRDAAAHQGRRDHHSRRRAALVQGSDESISLLRGESALKTLDKSERFRRLLTALYAWRSRGTAGQDK